MSPSLKFLFGLGTTFASAALFHGPGGYGERLLAGLDARVRPIVARQELPTVTAAFARDPLARDLIFRGPANDFQRQRFVEIIQEENILGLRSVGWHPASPPVNRRQAPGNAAR